tara:strand:+ start:1065 stop:1286 length:222 start_codon:yes stop_codon:yes gene_type:complete
MKIAELVLQKKVREVATYTTIFIFLKEHLQRQRLCTKNRLGRSTHNIILLEYLAILDKTKTSNLPNKGDKHGL